MGQNAKLEFEIFARAKAIEYRLCRVENDIDQCIWDHDDKWSRVVLSQHDVAGWIVVKKLEQIYTRVNMPWVCMPHSARRREVAHLERGFIAVLSQNCRIASGS